MPDIDVKPRPAVRTATERPKLYRVILVNDDYTPREFVVSILKGEFRLSEEQAYRVMMTAHRKGRLRHRRLSEGCRRDQGDARHRGGARQGLPLQFTTEPEE